MKKILTILLLIFINFFILGCIDKNDVSSSAFVEGECNLTTIYINTPLPERSIVSSSPDTPTIILLHGKDASPQDSHMQALANDFNFDGYNVVMPYMSWYGLNGSNKWDATYCENISYLNYLIVSETVRTNQIILAGHGLGATVALAYTALQNTAKTDALNVLAPAHFIQQSSILASNHADSIAIAKSMVENNESQVEATFYTSLYDNSIILIRTTPEIYLSFHDVDEFPNIEDTIPIIRVPMLWLAGEDDPLTSFAISHGIIDLIPPSETYKVFPGDHYTFLQRVSGEFNTWYSDLVTTP